MGNKRASCISNPLFQHIQLQIGTIQWHTLHSNLTRNATTKVLEKGLLERWKLDLVASKSEALNSNLGVQNDHVDAMYWPGHFAIFILFFTRFLFLLLNYKLFFIGYILFCNLWFKIVWYLDLQNGSYPEEPNSTMMHFV